MPDPTTISNIPLDHPGMDYAFLRQEGIKLIQQLAGSRWTDYNAHDPGITILEALCYAITDLSYRLSFSIEDLLAFPPDEVSHPLFLTARDILTVNPLTLNDYRKLLLDIDIKGIRVFKNTWLEPIKAPQPELFYDASNAKLTFNTLDSSNLIEPVHLKGLYRVLLEKRKLSEEERLLASQDTDLISAAKAYLSQHRNLCEDFAEFKILDIESISVEAEVEIADHVDPNQLMAQMYAVLDRAISPTIDFLSLSDLLSQGTPVEDIFVGPQLKHGFINDTQLEQFQRKTELRTSDLIHVIMDLPGVKAVRNITLASQTQPPQPWALDLNPELTPQLEPLANVLEKIIFYKGQIPCQLNESQVKAALKTSQPSVFQPSSTPVQDLPIPTGDYRELSDYESIQSEFPMVYGIGELGLPTSSSQLRKAQAKQLQAYLMVFDQILANYFAQLDHVRELFALANADTKTYFAQSIAHFPGAKDVLKKTDASYLKELAPGSAIDTDRINAERKNRFFSHLIAQYSETFIDDSLLYPDTTLEKDTVQHKVEFIQNYRQISAERGRAVDYQLNPVDQSLESQSHFISGLEQRLAQLLALKPKEEFYIIEHILLRPRPTSPKAISQFRQSLTTAGFVTCTSPQHGLQTDEKVNIVFSARYSGIYTISNVQDDSFDIETTFQPNYQPDKDAWVKSELLSLAKNRHYDPFSFQISVVFLNSPPRLQDSNFKQVISDTLIAETPAHITIHIHWLDSDQFRTLATDYDLLLKNLSGFEFSDSTSAAAAQAAATRLIDALGLGSTKIPPTPALIGYMVIGDASKGAPQFIVAKNQL